MIHRRKLLLVASAAVIAPWALAAFPTKAVRIVPARLALSSS